MNRKQGVCAVLVFALFLFGCGGGQDRAKKQALATFSELRKEQSGDKAQQLRERMIKELNSAGLKTIDISVDQAELEKYVRDAYYQDARKALAQLRDKKGDPEGAVKLREEFFRTARLSGRPMGELGASEAEVNRIVARNYLAAAAKQGVSLGPEDYKAAGLPAPGAIPKAKPRSITASGKKKGLRPSEASAVQPQPKKQPIGQPPSKKLHPSRS